MGMMARGVRMTRAERKSKHVRHEWVRFLRAPPVRLRWFGDLRRAVANETQTFCIDLRFWYPSKTYKYASFEVAPT